ncbi:WD40-repeat-containing domain protein [Dichotomopilus funicola]|uniref:WD40-repeat-containing domain protein n=1 Tax=Dichotomopilus funicola TaxID=1934379 RepID=A0AAN6ZNC3_9PEZI|nr:WD40-repeat-containing domain protein [Dichotomopilus funicola]
MNSLLLERSVGRVGPNEFARVQTTALLRSFAAASRFRFDGGERAAGESLSQASQTSGRSEGGNGGNDKTKTCRWAHQAGVSALAVERFDGRILVSGGTDATIKLWDLEQCANPSRSHVFQPVAAISRAATPSDTSAHRFGITHLSFYPFDSAAFLSCSHDQTLKLWDTQRASVSGSFTLGARVYTHAMSPVAAHLLVACGTQHPAVRLVDLRSSSAVQSLVSPGQIGGSAGATLAVAWSPVHEHVLASGSVDGAVRIWDVRKSNGLIALLDHEDTIGLVDDKLSQQPRYPQLTAKAHAGPVNGLTWTDDGAYLISTGHDRRIRVWDTATGANTLASFGPSIRNSGQMAGAGVATIPMFVSPMGLTPPGSELLFFPNESEILVMELHEGNVVTRLRGMGPTVAAVGTQRGERTVKNRVTSVAWRAAGGSGSSSGVAMGGNNAAGGLFSGHLDGQIRAWLPELEGTHIEATDDQTIDQRDEAEKTKKRKAIDDAFQSLMGRKVTFS